MFAALDTGTTNTRIYLVDHGQVISQASEAVGRSPINRFNQSTASSGLENSGTSRPATITWIDG
ncbi:MAG: hypothetical protein EOM13_10510 [Clostridia bacterium]|nr:hypothetical protein [Clostridia bacterium]